MTIIYLQAHQEPRTEDTALAVWIVYVDKVNDIRLDEQNNVLTSIACTFWVTNRVPSSAKRFKHRLYGALIAAKETRTKKVIQDANLEFRNDSLLAAYDKGTYRLSNTTSVALGAISKLTPAHVDQFVEFMSVSTRYLDWLDEGTVDH